MSNTKGFSVFDARYVHAQVKIDEEQSFSRYLIFSICKLRNTYTRLPSDIKTAPEIE